MKPEDNPRNFFIYDLNVNAVVEEETVSEILDMVGESARHHLYNAYFDEIRLTYEWPQFSIQKAIPTVDLIRSGRDN